MVDNLIQVSGVEKTFKVGEQLVPVLKGVSLEVKMGDFLVIIGPSGCGKSTLLNVILGLEQPDKGNVVFLGENIYANTDEDYRSSFRKKHIGMIYQQPNWIKSMKVVENVAFPLMLLGMEREVSLEKAMKLLQDIKMEQWAYYVPTELSGGQQQRISLVRALANNPEIIIADEPTGNLDYQTGQDVMQMLATLNHDQGKTLIMVTHDLEYLKFAHVAVRMLDGEVVDTYRDGDISKLMNDLSYKRGVKQNSNSGKQNPLLVKSKKVSTMSEVTSTSDVVPPTVPEGQVVKPNLEASIKTPELNPEMKIENQKQVREQKPIKTVTKNQIQTKSPTGKSISAKQQSKQKFAPEATPVRRRKKVFVTIESLDDDPKSPHVLA